MPAEGFLFLVSQPSKRFNTTRTWPGDLFGLLTGALGGLELLQFFGPDEVVEELPKQVQPHGESQANHKENDALGQVQHVQHRIHPDAAKVTDHVQPPQIAGHKDAEPGEAGLARRILPEAGANLQDHKDHNVRVHHMVQPTVERKRKKLIKFKPHTKKALSPTPGRPRPVPSETPAPGRWPSASRRSRRRSAPPGTRTRPACSPWASGWGESCAGPPHWCR